MPVTWTDTMDKEMLLHFLAIHTTTNSKADNETVANAMGEDFTAEAIKKRMIRLRKPAAASPADGTAASADGNPTAPKTPAKKTSRKKAAGEGTGSKRKASATKATTKQAEAGEDDDQGGSPSKKSKVVKEEITDEMD